MSHYFLYALIVIVNGALGAYCVRELRASFQKALARAAERRTATDEAFQHLQDTVESLSLRLSEAEGHLACLPPPNVPGASINLSKRSQALRRYRQGESVEQIATSLQTAKGEVALMLKVQQLTKDTYVPAN